MGGVVSTITIGWTLYSHSLALKGQPGLRPDVSRRNFSGVSTHFRRDFCFVKNQ